MANLDMQVAIQVAIQLCCTCIAKTKHNVDKVFCELMRIVRPFKNPVRETGPAPIGGRQAKPPKAKKDKKCAIL